MVIVMMKGGNQGENKNKAWFCTVLQTVLSAVMFVLVEGPLTVDMMLNMLLLSFFLLLF